MKKVSLLLLASAALVLSGCANGSRYSVSGGSSKCSKSTAQCQAKHKVRLRAMIADPTNKWVSDDSYKTGQLTSTVRLLAYLGSLKQLTCTQLYLGQLETNVSKGALQIIKRNKPSAKASNLSRLANTTNRAIKTRQKQRCNGMNPK